MRMFVMIVFTTLLRGSCFGAEVERLYFVGESKMCDPPASRTLRT